MRKMLVSLGYTLDTPTTIWVDNQGAIAIATNNRGMTHRTKHVAVRHFFVRQHVTGGDIVVPYIPTEENLADIFTKPCQPVIFARLSVAMNLTLKK